MKPQSSSPSSAAALLAFLAVAFALSWTCWLLAPALKVDFPVEATALSLTGDFGSSLAAVVLQLERLMDYPMVRERVEVKRLALHGWHYVIEDGEVHVFDVRSGSFVPSSKAGHSGTGPYAHHEDALAPVNIS